ncbi:MAG: carboxy terminal-processing peptidase [Saprospiraceae bacterium]|nr:carboxy terminal-processing peptidase [Saprospiraceae bacterium]
MRLHKPVFYSLVAVGLFAAAFFPNPTDQEKEAVLMQAMLKGLEQMHYDPPAIDDEFSKKVFDFYLENIDGAKRFFTQKEIAQLEAYRLKLDDEAKAGSFECFNLSLELLNAAMNKTQGYYREILAKPFDFTVDEKVELDGDKRTYAKNDAELKEYWRRYLKYETLERLVSKLDAQEKETEKKTAEELEKISREDILKLFDDFYDRLSKLKREDRLSAYLNAISGIYDPHTNYFQPIERENFDIRFSGRLEGIGAQLLTDGDYTKVSSIVVGGPAWKGKDLQENDVILSVAQGSAEPVDIKGMQINDVVQLVRGAKDTEVRLTVKKVDGTVKVISIIRDIVVLDERFAKSLILDGASKNEKIGFIYLPSFYADFEHRDGRFCSQDVAIEIAKLKAEKVDGIILDLRNNTGGSLNDVVRMSGFFIEKGPIVQVKSRNGMPDVQNDVDAGVQYNGPLIVMVNSYSASASEILAAALQDYNRAIIVGSSPSTFGKGTVQRFVDLDRTIRGFEQFKPLGSVKMTMQKFYRINGGSTQKKGVIPDIILPDSYYYLKTGEQEEKYSLDWTEIEPVAYSQNVMKIKNLDKIKANSEARTKNSEVFRKMLENAKRLEAQREMTAYPLKLEAYRAFEKELQASAEPYKNLMDAVVNTGIQNPNADVAVINADESKKARNEDWIKTVSKDIYLKETLQIMHDLISQHQ